MLEDLFRLDGRTAILTGASSGLGRRFAHVLHAAGASVVIAARRADRLEALAADLGDRVAPVPIDVTDPDAAELLCATALERFGSLDVVVNNAGISRVVAAVDDELADFRHEVELDLVAPYELSRAAARHMIAAGTGGSIVSTGSVLGSVAGGRLRVPGYAAAKGGLHNLTRELASQWARRGIRVNVIAPGWFASEMTDEMFETGSGRDYITAGAPMGRPGEEHELDGALLFLVTDASSYVTGQILHVDGGWTAI